jgi:hypothetical protein
MSLTREQALLEYAKCANDTAYALKTYLQTYDNTQSKYVPLELFNDQVTLVKDYDECEENIALKYRQAGVSTVTSAWASKRLVFARKEKPEKILIIANKLDTAVEMANKVRAFVDQWPKWMGVGFSSEKNSQRHFKLTNGCEVKAVATSKDALRGYTPTILIFDEAAYIDADEDFWSACMASLSTGGKVIVISTPNGFDPIYYSIYNQAIKGMNDFRITEMYWWRDPRYSKDLKLIKCDDIVHYMLNRSDYRDDEITIDYTDTKVRERDFEDIKIKIETGYKAYSSWFEAMAKKLKFDRRKISQELECVDGDTLVTIRNKNTYKIQSIKISELYSKLNKTRYEILSPEGFVDFDGIQKLNKKTREIIFNNNLTLRGSYNHKIYDFNGVELYLKDLKKGDKIKSQDGLLNVVDIIDYDYESEVYDIINAGSLHLYYTNGIISHNCNFLGSGDNVIPPETMKKIKDNFIKEPENKFMGGVLWQWKEPVAGHRYISGADISRGDSEDFTTFTIIDFDTREQVLEYMGKVPPDVVAEILYKWATMYSAFIVIDITGGMGVATSRKLQEMGYKNLYVDGVNHADKWKWDPKAQDKIPGLNFNSKRVQIIASFEEALRHDFAVRSQRLYNELNTFVYVNGRPDHQKGQHDDLIMAMAMALYVGETSFAKLEKATEQAKAMLESWSVESNNYSNSYVNFNPGLPVSSPNTDQFGKSQLTKSDYEKYLWLFGGKRV